MAIPSTRNDLVAHCLRRLGAPVIEVNVDPDQIEDCVDDAIQFFQEFHSDASNRMYISHQITADDVTNKWIPIPASVLTVIRLLPFDQSSLGVGSGMFSVKYQMAMSDLLFTNGFIGDLAYWEQFGQFLTTLDMVLTGVPLISTSRYDRKLHIHGEWWDNELKVGDWVVMEAYVLLQPEDAPGIYNNKFIKNYLTALIKQRWGSNMSKFDGVQLPGGVTISGQRIYDEATTELKSLEEQMRMEYELPPDFFVG